MPAGVDIDATMQKYVQAFRAIKARDLAEQPSWTANWLYDRDYAIYKSPQDLIRWFEWFRPEECAHYLPEERISVLSDESESHSRRILRPILSAEYKYRHVDEYNAVDFMLQNLYPVPPRMRPKRVLDFGAGYGRQMNLWSRVTDPTYVAVDSVEPRTLCNHSTSLNSPCRYMSMQQVTAVSLVKSQASITFRHGGPTYCQTHSSIRSSAPRCPTAVA
jgi:hypothetical protein